MYGVVKHNPDNRAIAEYLALADGQSEGSVLFGYLLPSSCLRNFSSSLRLAALTFG